MDADDRRAALLDLGFPDEAVELALLRTRGQSVAAAAIWLTEQTPDQLQCQQAELMQANEQQSGQHGGSLAVPVSSEPVLGYPSSAAPRQIMNPDGRQTSAVLLGVHSECKMVLIVSTGLNMGTGKVAAQCAHAALGLYKVICRERSPWLQAWEAEGEKTVVLAAPKQGQLRQLQLQAQALNLPTFLVEDAGRTEVAPGSQTVLAICGISDIVDAVSGQLRTLR